MLFAFCQREVTRGVAFTTEEPWNHDVFSYLGHRYSPAILLGSKHGVVLMPKTSELNSFLASPLPENLVIWRTTSGFDRKASHTAQNTANSPLHRSFENSRTRLATIPDQTDTIMFSVLGCSEWNRLEYMLFNVPEVLEIVVICSSFLKDGSAMALR